MLNILFTLDYEIHGNGDGCPRALMVEPTHRILDFFDHYGAKLTIMADVAEVLKFKEYKETHGQDDYHYEAIADQLREAIGRGHDVQLHLHSSYFNARHQEGRWVQDWSEYNLARLKADRLDFMVRIGKVYLESLLQPIRPDYRCCAFRAANWSVSPSRNLVRALVRNGIQIDTSVFKYGQRAGLVNFDYSNAPSELEPWPVDEEDICKRNENGQLFEVPIYTERRWVGAFLTPNRIYRAKLGRAHRIQNHSPGFLETETKKSLLSKMSLLTRKHPWKADFNQCTGGQLIRALRRAARNHDCGKTHVLPFVLIGHSKLYTSANELSLAPFLKTIAQNPARFQFGVLQDVFQTIAAEKPSQLCQ